MEYRPLENWALSANYLHKVEGGMPTSNILTLQSGIEFPANIFTEIEVGQNFLPGKDHKDNRAYRIETSGKFGEDSRFYFEKVYAGPEFYGYYSHLHLLSSSLDIPLCNRFRLNVSLNRFVQNFDSCFEDEEIEDNIIPKQHQYSANLTYQIHDGCSFALNGLLLRGEDLGLTKQYDFYQKWGGCSFFISSYGYHLNSIVSFGQQKDFLTHKTTHFLQRYYAYLGKDFSPEFTASIFYDGGNINYYDAGPWRSSYGGSLAYRFSSAGCLELFMQKVKQPSDSLDMSQITFNMNYTFQNFHKLQATAQYFYYPSHYPNDTMFLISYSIPFTVPICRRQDVGDIGGVIYNSWNNTLVAGALVGCETGHSTTGIDGRFDFNCLPRGEYQPKIEMLPEDLITSEAEETYITVPGGGRTELCIPVVPSCTIRGEIILYSYKDIFEMLADQENVEIVPQEGVEGVRLAFIRGEGKEIYTCMTDAKGAFHVPKLRPGEWHIRIFTDLVPPQYELDINNLVLDIQPGEERFVSFKVLPKPPELYKIGS